MSSLSLAEIAAHIAVQPVDAKRIKGLATSGTLDYAAITADAAVTATSEATAQTIVTGNSVTYDGSTAVDIQFFCPAVFNNNAARRLIVVVLDGSTVLATILEDQHQASTNDLAGYCLHYPVTPSAAAHTYSIAAWVSAATVTVRAGVSGASTVYGPAFMRITSV